MGILKQILLLSALFTFLLSEHSLAENSAPWVSPTSDPFNAKIEEGWNYHLQGGASFANGRTRGNFVSVDPWSEGWVSRLPSAEVGIAYAPSSKWELGLQVPLTIASSTLNAYYRVSDNVKLGLKFGYFSTLSTTFSLYPVEKWFVSLTPSIGFNRFGFPSSKTVNTASFGSPATFEKLRQSRVTANGQLAIGRHIDPFDLALLVNYAYAPGNGIDNSFFFDDTFMKHFLRISVGLVF